MSHIPPVTPVDSTGTDATDTVNHAVRVNVVAGGGSGGTSSSFGAAFPATGTAVGAKDNVGNMAALNLDASGNLKVVTAGGGSAVTIANGADVAEGSTTDVAITSDINGTVIGFLRGLVKILANVWDSGNSQLRTSANQGNPGPPSGAWPIQIADEFARVVDLTPASTPTPAASVSVPVGLSPDSPLPVGTNVIGKVDLDPVTVTGNLANNNDTVSIACSGVSAIAINVVGTWTGTISFQGSADGGTNWNTVRATRITEMGTVRPAVLIDSTGDGNKNNSAYIIGAAGMTNFRLLATPWTSGTANITLTGNPAAVAGPILTMITGPNGTTPVPILADGSLSVSLSNGSSGIATAPLNADGIATTGSPGLFDFSVPALYNGTSYDRARGTIANGLAVDVTRVTGNVAVTNAGLSNLDVALSTRLKPADTLTKVATVDTITNVVHVDDNGGSLTVDATSWPLPTGAATEATLATRAADSTLTGGTAKSIVRGGAKGATAAADVTSTNQSADRQALDVQIRTSSGAVVDSFGGSAVPATSTLSRVNPAWRQSVVLLASNVSRKEALIVNETNAPLYLKEGAGASDISYSVVIPPRGRYALDGSMEIDGFWNLLPTDGQVVVTERV